MAKAPKVCCPKEERKVPIWWCLGSYVQGKEPCGELLEAVIDISEDYADVKCKQRESL
jgi:hypothetical protein